MSVRGAADSTQVTPDENTTPAAHVNASPAPTVSPPRSGARESEGPSNHVPAPGRAPGQATVPNQARRGVLLGRAPEPEPVVEKAARRRPTRRQVVVGAVAAVLTAGGVIAATVVGAPTPPETVSLSEALTTIADGDVSSATVQDGASTVSLTLDGGRTVEARYPDAYADEVTGLLVELDVPLTTESGEKSFGAQLALTTLPLLVIMCVLVFALRLANPNQMFGGKKKALTSGEVPQVTFADVAGADEAVDQLQEMVQFLREPGRFEAVGATRPRGALLVGPPGTGKTLLARAVAGEAQVPFFALAGSDFVETFVGVGARRVRDLFAQARKAERAIIFIDEIDAVGRTRSSNASNGGDGERENTLISLLNEMDGFAGSNIIVLAATNRADTLDPALTRPGRLDRQVQVPNPDRRGRTLILQVHAASRPLGTDVDFVTIARQTPGMSGADLAQVVNEACMEAARRDQAVVDHSCFQAAIATVAMGRARTSALVTEYDRRITAWHEAGHTLAAAILPDADDPVSVTIVPRGPAGGVTWMSGNDDVFLPRKKALARLVVALAGRAAEEYLLDGEHTQGASSDLHGATDLATAMVTQYGMTDFGYAQVDSETLRVGGHVAAQAHARIDGLLREAHTTATELLRENGAVLEALASALLAEETLSGGRVRQIIAECQDAVRSGDLHAVHGA
ncbi:MAG: FtsH-2 peptidase [Actinotalea sp.]|nr:FtsH-2 peptidase [Actinotalea sp.]